MSLKKVTYVAEQTVITAENLNNIQDNIILNAENIETNNNILSAKIDVNKGNHTQLSNTVSNLSNTVTKNSDKLNALSTKINNSVKTFTATITTTWSGSGPYTQNVTINGILSTDNPHIMPNYSTTNATAISQKEAWNCISKAITAENTITFTCFEEKPTTAIPILIEVNRGG